MEAFANTSSNGGNEFGASQPNAFDDRFVRPMQAQGQQPEMSSRYGRSTAMKSSPVSSQPTMGFGGSSGSSSLVAEARRYIGGNPTGRRSLWCGAFMDMILKRTGHKGGGNLARAYANYGPRVSGPQVGAIAVMARKGGGHVGVVSGIDQSGNPIIISGNHGRRVAESTYSRGRILAYVLPNG
jgi:uncharacterized protein (TIGR02594 family)